MLGQVLDREQRVGFAALPGCAGLSGRMPEHSPDCDGERGCYQGSAVSAGHSRTSMACRRPSLMRLKHIEVMKIIAPGKAATNGDTHSA